MVNPAAVTVSATGRVSRQPPRRRCSSGSSRRCRRCTDGSGARPCSTKWKVPPGLSTRRTSARAAARVGDRAEGPCGQRRVAAVVGERQRLAVQAGPVDRDGGRLEPFVGESPGHLGRVDGGDVADRPRVERHVQSGSEADLEDVSGQAGADAAAMRFGVPVAAHDVDHPGEDLPAVEPHPVLGGGVGSCSGAGHRASSRRCVSAHAK